MVHDKLARKTECKIANIETEHYILSLGAESISLPLPEDTGSDGSVTPTLPTPIPGGGGMGGINELDPVAGEGVDGADNCHAGMDGFDGKTGVVNPLEPGGPRLRSNALSDFSSCCSSARDCI